MRFLDDYFGTSPATRITKSLFYISWLSMLPNFFKVSWRGKAWMNYSMPLVLLSFLAVGFFSIFASKQLLIDFWRTNTRIGKELADPKKGPMTINSFRMVGIFLVLGVFYISYEILHFSTRISGR